MQGLQKRAWRSWGGGLVMSPKHTPGEWEIGFFDDMGNILVVFQKENRAFNIASVSQFNPNRHADGLLIKAAPDLLGACQIALEGITAIKALDRVPVAVQALRTAIAKALGES